MPAPAHDDDVGPQFACDVLNDQMKRPSQYDESRGLHSTFGDDRQRIAKATADMTREQGYVVVGEHAVITGSCDIAPDIDDVQKGYLNISTAGGYGSPQRSSGNEPSVAMVQGNVRGMDCRMCRPRIGTTSGGTRRRAPQL